MSNLDNYRAHCLNEKSIPFFSNSWWLDTVCPNSWDVCLVEKGGQIFASMPYYNKKKFGLNLISSPQLTQTLGPWLKSSTAKPSKRYAEEKKLLSNLISQLPNFDYFNQNLNYKITNWLPFYWNGFTQTTRYTYRFSDLSDLEKIWSGLRENIRTDIRKAQKNHKIKIRTDLTIEDFIPLNFKTFARQGTEPPYTADYIRNIDNACEGHSARKIFIAEDGSGARHAAVYIVWDNQNAYYLLGGGDPKLRSSGATSYCLWEAIKFAGSMNKSFDFEGSMIEPIERVFRSFGAEQTAYFNVSKIPSRILKIRNHIKDIFKI